MSMHYETSAARPRHSGASLACASATLCSVALGTSPTHALELDWKDGLITETVAERERKKTYDNAQLYGAELVQQRDRSFAQPDGGRLGFFMFNTGVETQAAWNDNIFGTSTDPIGDLKTELAPYLVLRSDLPRHVIEMSLDGRLVSYLENQDQNYADVQGRVGGALHIDHAHTFSADVSSSIRHEERGSTLAPLSAAEPVQILYNKAAAGITRDVGRLYGTLSAGAEQWLYDDVEALDGSTLDQSGRDSEMYSAQIRLGYRFSPGYDAVGRFRTYRLLNNGEGDKDQTSNGYEVMAGLSFETSPLLRFKILGGYGTREFDNPDLDPVSSYLLEGDVYWLATQQITFTGIVKHAITDTLGADERGSAIETVLGGRVDVELRHDLVANAGAEFVAEEFVESGRTDDTYTLRAGLDWYYTKNWLFTLGYEYQVRNSNVDEAEMTRNIARIGAKLQF